MFVGLEKGDTLKQAMKMAERVVHLRIFEDDVGKINAGLLDVDGAALIISQFTLYADVRKGRRPGFSDAALPDVAEPLVEHFAQAMRDCGVPVETGVFGAHMMVEIHNDGPVTILVEK